MTLLKNKKYIAIAILVFIVGAYYLYNTTKKQLDVDLIVKYYNEGAKLLEDNKNTKALELFDKALKLDPNSKFKPLYFNKGLALKNLKKYQEAIDNYNMVIKLDSNFAPVYLSKGVALSMLGKNTAAIESFDKAIELDPKSSYAYNNKGAALGNLRKYQEAIDNYNKAIELDPKNFEPHKNKFCPLYNLKRYEEAVETCDKAIELEPNRPDIQEVIVNRLKALNKLEKIAKEY